MNGVILGFEIALGIALFLIALRLVFGSAIKAFWALFNFQAWGEKHRTADTVLFYVTAILIVSGIVFWLLKTPK